MADRRFCILVNPHASDGLAMRVLPAVEKKLSRLPIQFRVVTTANVKDAELVAAQAIRQGEYLAVMGGDGTARAAAKIASELHGTLAFIPCGRGNDLMRVLNLPLEPLAACDVLAYGRETEIDLGYVNQQPFLGICSLGFDSDVNQLVSRVKLIKGPAVYLYAGLRALFSWKPIKFKLNIDGKAFEHVGHTVAAANSSTYGGGMRLAPYASLQDGLFDVVLIGAIPKWRMLFNVPRIFKGTHINEPGFKVIRGRHITIEADTKFTIYADGDAISAPPATITMASQSLRVLTPQDRKVDSDGPSQIFDSH